MVNTNAATEYSTCAGVIVTHIDYIMQSALGINPDCYLLSQIHTYSLKYSYKLCILAVTIAYHYGCLTKDGRILKDLAKRDYVDWQPTRMSK
jgi:hypothetical protein